MNSEIELLKMAIAMQHAAIERLNYALSAACYSLAGEDEGKANAEYYNFLNLAESERQKMSEAEKHRQYLENIYQKS